MSILQNFRRSNALKYLKNTDYSVLISASNQVQEYIINEKQEIDGTVLYSHHLPLMESELPLKNDNWDLPETDKIKIKNALKMLGKYQKAVINAYFLQLFKKSNSPIEFIHELLPPWIVFPLYDSATIGWRIGSGEAYMKVFTSYIDTLSEEQYKAYAENYPTPVYMETSRFTFNTMNTMNHHCLGMIPDQTL
jgi:hypothetical protein